jgi:hypothetical protein
MRKNILLFTAALFVAAVQVVALPGQSQAVEKPILTSPTAPAPTPTKPTLPPPTPLQTKPVSFWWQEDTPSIYHQSGSQIQDGNLAYVWSSDPANPNTYMWYGPYVNLPTGKSYQACWNLRSPVNDTVMTLDVAYNGGVVSNSTVLNVPFSLGYNKYCVNFYAAPGQASFEFRAMAHQGTAYIDDLRVNSL